MGKTIGIIDAQMTSPRLPGKILAPLADRTLLEQLHQRITRSRVDQWWLATSSDPSDDVTEAWGFELGVRVYRGSGLDVLSRFVAIGAETRADWIVRVVADNPFVDASLVDRLLDARDATREAKRADLMQPRSGLSSQQECAEDNTAARLAPALPLGYDAQLIRSSSLERADREIPPQQSHHRTHVGSWLSGQGEVYDVPTPAGWPDRRDWRWVVDTYEDLAMARSAFRLFGSQASTIDYPAMVAMLDAHPEITARNAHVPEGPLEGSSAGR